MIKQNLIVVISKTFRKLAKACFINFILNDRLYKIKTIRVTEFIFDVQILWVMCMLVNGLDLYPCRWPDDIKMMIVT